jgi:hypothetical protein
VDVRSIARWIVAGLVGCAVGRGHEDNVAFSCTCEVDGATSDDPDCQDSAGAPGPWSAEAQATFEQDVEDRCSSRRSRSACTCAPE